MKKQLYQLSAVDNPEWAPYLFDTWGNSYSKRIVRYRGKNWFVKCMPQHPQASSRERLAYLLGRNISNIAEVQRLTWGEIAAIQRSGVLLPDQATPRDTYLVRLGFDYSWLGLRIKNLDHAMAAELVFSIWIRRRDAHSFNRVYVRGIPVFFDHLTGLLGEPALVDLDTYFNCGPDAGYAGWLRIEEVQSQWKPDPLILRRSENEVFANGISRGSVLCPVLRKDRMRSLLFKISRRIRLMPSWYLTRMASQAGFDRQDSEAITAFLTASANELDTGIERLCSMFQLPPKRSSILSLSRLPF